MASFVGRSAHSQVRHTLKDPLGKMTGSDQATSAIGSLNAKRAAGSYAKQLYDGLASKPIKVDAELKKLRAQLADKNLAPAARQALLRSIEKGEKKFEDLDKTTRKMAADSGAQLALLAELQAQLAILMQIAGDPDLPKGTKDVVNGIGKDIDQIVGWMKKTDFTAVDFMSMKEDLDELDLKLNALPSDMGEYINRKLKEQYKAQNDVEELKEKAKAAKEKAKAAKEKAEDLADSTKSGAAERKEKADEDRKETLTEAKTRRREQKEQQEREDFYASVDDKLEEAEEFLADHQKTLRAISANVGNSLLKIGDKIGIGFVNLGNVARLGMSATRFIRDPRGVMQGSKLYKGAQAIKKYGQDYQRAKQITSGNFTPLRQEFKTAREEEQAGSAEHGISVDEYNRKKRETLHHLRQNNIKAKGSEDFSKMTLTDLLHKARGTKPEKQRKTSSENRQSLDEYQPRRMASNDSVASPSPVAIATPLNAPSAPASPTFGVEPDNGDEEFRREVVTELQEQSTYGRRQLRAMERIGTNLGRGNGSFLGGLTDGIKGIGAQFASFFGEGGLIKGITAAIGGVGTLIAGALTGVGAALAVAGAAFVGWKIGKAIYDKFLGDNPTFQSITDKVLDFVTGQNAQGKGLTDTPEQAKAKDIAQAKQRVDDSSYDAMGNYTGMGAIDTSSPAPADTGGKVVIKAAKGAAAATATGISNMFSGGASSMPPGADTVGASTVANSSSKASSPSTMSSVGGKISDFVGSVFSKSGNANTDKIDPEVQGRFSAMGQEYQKITGKKLTITSGFRTAEEQANIKTGYSKASAGNSWHQYGQALDVDHTQVNQLKQMGLLQKYGFTQPFPDKDPVHIQSSALAINPKAAGMPVGGALATARAVGGDSARASSAREGFKVPEPQVPDVAQANTTPAPASKSGAGTIGSDSKVGVHSIPTIDMSDSHLVAMNVGMFS